MLVDGVARRSAADRLGAQSFVHGHVVIEEPQFRPNRIGIDTSTYKSGCLTCLLATAGAPMLLVVDDAEWAPVWRSPQPGTAGCLRTAGLDAWADRASAQAAALARSSTRWTSCFSR